MTGIYMLTNVKTGNRYVGKSINIKRRYMEHKTPRAALTTKSPLFKRELAEYGIGAYELTVLEECDASKLNERELHWIHKLQPEYNTIGKAIPDEQRRRTSVSVRQYWDELPSEKKQQIIKHQLIGPAKGHAVSESTRKKLHDAFIGTGKYAVRIVETGQTFENANACAQALRCAKCTIYNQIKGRTKALHNGYHLERVETNRDECNGVGRR